MRATGTKGPEEGSRIARIEAKELRELVARVRRGRDEEAFAILVRRCESTVRAGLAVRVADPARLDEIVQESFVRAWLNLDTLKRDEAFLAWLLGIGRRVVLERARRSKEPSLERLEERELPMQPPASSPDPELDRALRRLPERSREVVLLRFHAGLSCEEIARTLDCPLGTVTKTLSRAYATLRRDLSAGERPPDDPRLERCR